MSQLADGYYHCDVSFCKQRTHSEDNQTGWGELEVDDGASSHEQIVDICPRHVTLICAMLKPGKIKPPGDLELYIKETTKKRITEALKEEASDAD